MNWTMEFGSLLTFTGNAVQYKQKMVSKTGNSLTNKSKHSNRNVNTFESLSKAKPLTFLSKTIPILVTLAVYGLH